MLLALYHIIPVASNNSKIKRHSTPILVCGIQFHYGTIKTFPHELADDKYRYVTLLSTAQSRKLKQIRKETITAGFHTYNQELASVRHINPSLYSISATRLLCDAHAIVLLLLVLLVHLVRCILLLLSQSAGSPSSSARHARTLLVADSVH